MAICIQNMQKMAEVKVTLYLHLIDNMEKVIPITLENFDEWNIQKQFLNEKKPYKTTKDGKKIPKKSIKE